VLQAVRHQVKEQIQVLGQRFAPKTDRMYAAAKAQLRTERLQGLVDLYKGARFGAAHEHTGRQGGRTCLLGGFAQRAGPQVAAEHHRRAVEILIGQDDETIVEHHAGDRLWRRDGWAHSVSSCPQRGAFAYRSWGR